MRRNFFPQDSHSLSKAVCGFYLQLNYQSKTQTNNLIFRLQMWNENFPSLERKFTIYVFLVVFYFALSFSLFFSILHLFTLTKWWLDAFLTTNDTPNTWRSRISSHWNIYSSHVCTPLGIYLVRCNIDYDANQL